MSQRKLLHDTKSSSMSKIHKDRGGMNNNSIDVIAVHYMLIYLKCKFNFRRNKSTGKKENDNKLSRGTHYSQPFISKLVYIAPHYEGKLQTLK